jgi:hypothetical protein
LAIGDCGLLIRDELRPAVFSRSSRRALRAFPPLTYDARRILPANTLVIFHLTVLQIPKSLCLFVVVFVALTRWIFLASAYRREYRHW